MTTSIFFFGGGGAGREAEGEGQVGQMWWDGQVQVGHARKEETGRQIGQGKGGTAERSRRVRLNKYGRAGIKSKNCFFWGGGVHIKHCTG